MNNMCRTIAFSIVIGCFSFTLFGQSATHTFQKTFEDHVTHSYQEKILIHTDREHYITGETLWMSLYALDAATHKLSGLSKVVNIELVDPKGKPMIQTRMQLEQGRGNGQMFVKAEIPTGNYILRGYTNWMKNNESGYAFEKNIRIVNPSVTHSQPHAPEKIPTSPDLNIAFFPEGGQILYGLKSKVVVKATSGQTTTGVVYDSHENEITRFTTDIDGYAVFDLTPEANKQYFARVAHEGKVKKVDIPRPASRGVALRVAQSEKRVNIICSRTLNAPKEYYLVVHTRGVLQHIVPISMPENQTSHPINKETLPPGITHITLLSADFRPHLERLIYVAPKRESLLRLQTNKEVYASREPIQLELNNLMSDTANLSIAVVPTWESDIQQTDFARYLFIDSDLQHFAPTARQYTSREELAQLDKILICQSWNRFDWNDIAESNTPSYAHLPEVNAPILSGKIDLQDTSSTRHTLHLSFLGKSSFMNSYRIEDDGRFYFEVPFRLANDQAHFFMPLENGHLAADQISLDSPFDYPFKNKFTLQPLSPASRQNFETLATNIQVSQVYRDFTHINGIAAAPVSYDTHFYGEADVLYPLDDYTRFETTKDLFIEYIRAAVVRDNNRKSGFYVPIDRKLSTPALTLIDGIPILDHQYVLDFDILKVEKIGVVNKRYFMGASNYAGIINFTTYKGDFNGKELPDHIIEKVYHAVQQVRAFYHPDYDVNEKNLRRIPDYRNTLYWNPQVTSTGKSSLRFFTGDQTGSYDIIIHGISQTGTPISLKKTITVKQQLP